MRLDSDLPAGLGDLAARLGAGSLVDIELSQWAGVAETAECLVWPRLADRTSLLERLACQPLVPRSARWRIVAIVSVVVGPCRFNGGLDRHGNKASVHFDAFRHLLRLIWDRAADGRATYVNGDKHGGRHFYFQPLSQSFPDAWIDRGPEGPELSFYTIREGGRRLELSLTPCADQADGLVALASIVSKTVRELWMDVFNEYWRQRIPGLRPTAGYPGDSRRFREEIEPIALAEGHDPARWWRTK